MALVTLDRIPPADVVVLDEDRLEGLEIALRPVVSAVRAHGLPLEPGEQRAVAHVVETPQGILGHALVLSQPPGSLQRAIMDPLPIDSLLPQIVDRVREDRCLVLEAPTGAGKTTRVPVALLEVVGPRDAVLVLEPRRLAARLAATRTAAERGERVGQSIGYQVRFENKAGKRLTYLTEGLFTRRLLSDPELRGVGAVVLDEFHERHLDTDLALVMLDRLRTGPRPDLAVVVMSATLDGARVSDWLGGQVIRSKGRLHPVHVEHLEREDGRRLEEQVLRAVKSLVRDGLDGDVLVFLPGAAEIRRARDALEEFARHADLLLAALHGSMPAAEQDRAIAPTDRRKVILSTNVAESSVTIEGVVAVIDSGLCRAAGHSVWSGLPTLVIDKISQASAIQRTGRAGRLRPGRCLRLFTRHDFSSRPRATPPEIHRSDLASLLLQLASAGIHEPNALRWLDPPPSAAVESGRALLSELGALSAEGITEEGRQMLSLPVHPRVARLVLEATARGVREDGCLVAALLGERDLVDAHRRAPRAGPSDLLDRVESFREAAAARFRGLGRMNVHPGAARAVDRAWRQLLRAAPEGTAKGDAGDRDEALLRAVLAAYPDRVARRRQPGGKKVLLVNGTEATLAEGSVVREAEFLVAVDMAANRKGTPVRLASAIEPDWLIDLFPDRIEESVDAEWNSEHQRVEVFLRMRFGAVVLSESRGSAAEHPEAAALLARQILKSGVSAVADPAAVATLQRRLRLAAQGDPGAGLPELDEARIESTVASLCVGCSRLSEVRQADLIGAFLQSLTRAQRQALDTMAPTHLTLPRRKRAPIEYPADAPPFVASRIQDFFGLHETPRIAGGSVELQIRLLAPNGRPAQITSDLAGFWTRHYPDIRRELSRRYPKHAWPEDPG